MTPEKRYTFRLINKSIRKLKILLNLKKPFQGGWSRWCCFCRGDVRWCFVRGCDEKYGFDLEIQGRTKCVFHFGVTRNFLDGLGLEWVKLGLVCMKSLLDQLMGFHPKIVIPRDWACCWAGVFFRIFVGSSEN